MQEKNLLDEYRRNHSDDVFAEIVTRYINPVFSTCLREVRDRQAAEDLTQAVFLLLARKADSLSPKVVLSGWLFNASRLVARNAMRKERRRREREQKASIMQGSSDSTHWNALDEVLNDALAALSNDDRIAILLRYFDELSVPEIARELNVSPDAAEKRVSRALERLRRAVARLGTAIPTAALAEMLISTAVKPARAALAGQNVSQGSVVGSGTTIIVEEVMKQTAFAKLKAAAFVFAFVIVGLGITWHYSHLRAAAAVSRDAGPKPTIASLIKSWQQSDAMLDLRLHSYRLHGSVDISGPAQSGRGQWDYACQGDAFIYKVHNRYDRNDWPYPLMPTDSSSSYDGDLWCGDIRWAGLAGSPEHGTVYNTNPEARTHRDFRRTAEENSAEFLVWPCSLQHSYHDPLRFPDVVGDDLSAWFKAHEKELTVSGPDFILGRSCYSLNLSNWVGQPGGSANSEQVWLCDVGNGEVFPVQILGARFINAGTDDGAAWFFPTQVRSAALQVVQKVTFTAFRDYDGLRLPIGFTGTTVGLQGKAKYTTTTSGAFSISDVNQVLPKDTFQLTYPSTARVAREGKDF